MAVLELDKVSKSFGPIEVVHEVDLRVEDGEFCVLVGPSGCGKSTLLRMIAGLEEISAGRALIDGAVVNHVGPAERGLAMVFQSYALYPHMSVRQNLAFGLENLRMARPAIAARVAEAARMLQIEPLLDRRPRALSGGQRQRVAIGRAVVREPKIFLFDEPLSNLDAELRVAMRTEITELHARLGNTMLYVTHDQTEAMTMADRICVLRAGRVEQVGHPLELYNHPANRFVAGFIGSPRMNFLDAAVERATGEQVEVVVGGRVPVVVPACGAGLRRGDALTLGLRPQDVRIVERGGLGLRITAVEHLGGESYLHGSLEHGGRLTVKVNGQAAVARGAAVAVAPDPSGCHLFRSDTAAPALPRPRAAEAPAPARAGEEAAR